jgi:hypothetical protein
MDALLTSTHYMLVVLDAACIPDHTSLPPSLPISY